MQNNYDSIIFMKNKEYKEFSNNSDEIYIMDDEIENRSLVRPFINSNHYENNTQDKNTNTEIKIMVDKMTNTDQNLYDSIDSNDGCLFCLSFNKKNICDRKRKCNIQ
jgi:hypothetical protein